MILKQVPSPFAFPSSVELSPHKTRESPDTRAGVIKRLSKIGSHKFKSFHASILLKFIWASHLASTDMLWLPGLSGPRGAPVHAHVSFPSWECNALEQGPDAQPRARPALQVLRDCSQTPAWQDGTSDDLFYCNKTQNFSFGFNRLKNTGAFNDSEEKWESHSSPCSLGRLEIMLSLWHCEVPLCWPGVRSGGSVSDWIWNQFSGSSSYWWK